MAVQGVTTIKATFETGDRPTQAQFIDLIDTAVVSGAVSAGAAGAKVLTAITTASAQQAAGLSVGAVGLKALSAITTASAQQAAGLSVGAVGLIQLDQATTASAQTVVGGGAAGRTVFQAITTASARQGLDIGAVTTAQMSAPTNTSSAFVTPGLQHFHPLHPKAWVYFEGTGTVSILDSWNVASIGDLGLGFYRVNWGSAFANNRYALAVTNDLYAVANAVPIVAVVVGISAGAKAAGDAQVVTFASNPSTTINGTDVSGINVFAWSR